MSCAWQFIQLIGQVRVVLIKVNNIMNCGELLDQFMKILKHFLKNTVHVLIPEMENSPNANHI